MQTDASVVEAESGEGVRPAWWRRLVDAFLSIDRRRRIRLNRWLISAMVYLSSALVLAFGMPQSWLDRNDVLALYAFLVFGQAGFYVALRTGWSERFTDPALTAPQMVVGTVVAEWAYLVGGPVRSAMLLPLLLVFVFGAFSLSWRRILWLTAFAISSLIVGVVALNAMRSTHAWSLDDVDLMMDLTNVLMVIITLPALSLIAARLSVLRSKMNLQRSALTELLGRVQELATHDDLTGLANRRYMLERLSEQQSRFERQDHPFSIAIIDLDNFKQINDAFGHAGGDAVLQAFAAEATSMLRAGDLMARWGGEEFLLLLPDTPGPQARASVMRLLDRVRAIPQASGQALSFSAGVTEHRAGDTVADIVARADREMYLAKRSGRNAVRLQ